MSFDVYMQCFENGKPAGSPVEAVCAAFPHLSGEPGAGAWVVRYDETLWCDVYVSWLEGRPGYIHSFSINRPFGDARLWDSVYRVLQLGNWVLYFPAPDPPLVVADPARAEHLPKEMRESLGPLRSVTSGEEIRRIIRES